MESHDKAAFFRLEGTITSRSTVAAAAWMASHAQAFSDRLSRLGAVALSTPFRSVLRDAGTATRLSWSAVRGMSEDRTILLGEEHYELFYRDAYKDSGLEYLENARRDGFVPVLITDSLDVLVQPIATELGIEHVICNRLEFSSGKATGRLLSPISTGRVSGQQLNEMARSHQWRLGHCRGYGSQETDITLLSSIGQPCAVTPDRDLRSIAQDLNWPIVERA